MENFFSKQPASCEESDDSWLTISDMMSGLMIMFLFISLVFMFITKEQQGRVKEIALTYQETQVAIYQALNEEFANDFSSWGADIDKTTLAINFLSPDVLFANNEARLSDEYKAILNDFFPRYIKILKPFREALDEIRIEGHTSSLGPKNASADQAYFYNMALSQSRTRAVLEYGNSILPDEADWIKQNIAAVGFSSSRPVMVNGVENEARSRRVSFRAVTNAEIQIKRILEHDDIN